METIMEEVNEFFAVRDPMSSSSASVVSWVLRGTTMTGASSARSSLNCDDAVASDV